MLDTLTAADLAAGPGLVKLALVKHDLVLNTKADTLFYQTRHNLRRGLPEMLPQADRGFGLHTASLCGSGPSLMQNLGHVRGYVMACNAAIPALHKAGVKVHYAMIWDGTPEMVRYACDIPGCEWMIASRVHPDVLDVLLTLGQNVTLWHTATTDPDMTELYGRRTQVFGGPTGITRAPCLLGAMGFRDIRVFGADSSYQTETHVGGSLRNEEEVVSMFEGTFYRTTYWMMNQAETWVTFVLPELVPTGMRFSVYGDGLLPAAHRSWLRQCLPWHKRLAWKLLS